MMMIQCHESNVRGPNHPEVRKSYVRLPLFHSLKMFLFQIRLNLYRANYLRPKIITGPI
jgi:hypothetical protein